VPSIDIEINPLTATCCHVGTAVKHSVPDRVKPVTFVIFDIRALGLDVKNYK